MEDEKPKTGLRKNAQTIHPTKFMIGLKEKLLITRKLADTTANAYISCLVRINDNNMFSSLGFLKTKKDAVMAYLDEKDISNRLTYLSAIVASLSFFKDSPTYKKIYGEYQDEIRELKDEKDGSREPNTKTEKQEKNWEDWPVIMKHFDDLRAEVEEFKNEKKINRGQHSVLMDCMILGLYVLIEPRRNMDYLKMFVRYGGTVANDNSMNYYDFKEKRFEFNVFKTAKFMGYQEIIVPDKLSELIEIYMKFHPLLSGVSKKPNLVRFITNEDGGVPRENYITLRMKKIFKKNISTSMLRHIYISHTFGDEFREMRNREIERKKVADAMGHNLDMQKEYFVE